MESLTKIFGSVVPTFFAIEGGISLSEVARRQAEAKQENDGYWAAVKDATDGVFARTITVIGASGDHTKEIPGTPISAEKICEVEGVATRNATTATLMHAIKLHQRLREELKQMDLRPFVAESLSEKPVFPAQPKCGTVCNTNRFMELDTIDEMVANLNTEVLAKFPFEFWKEANGLNSKAAAIGKLLSSNGAFFRKVVEPLPQGEDRPTGDGVVITAWKRAYDDESLGVLTELRDQLQAKYNGLQAELNGYRKQIRDAVRAYNLDQERQYQAALGAYNIEAKAYELEVEQVRSAAEKYRQEALQEIAALRVRT